MNAEPTTLRATARARGVVLALVGMLCAVLVAWHVSRYSTPTALLASLVLVVPWALPLRGLLGGNRRTYALTTMIVPLYVAYALMEVLANPGARAYAGAVALLGFALFFALIAFLRVSRPDRPAPNGRTAP